MFDGKTTLITGGTGFIGRMLARKLCTDYKPKKVIIYSRDEFKQSEMAREYPYDNIRFIIGDVRDKDRLKAVCTSVDYVFHAAALKRIDSVEYNPTEAIKTNVLGSMNVVEACIENCVERAILISTDKACEPINLYGATKLSAEKLFIAANNYNKTLFCVARYGNIIGSRGSVIEHFVNLRKKNIKKFPITSPDMTRFWYQADRAVDLIMYAIKNSNGNGNIFVPYLQSMKITEVAKAIDPNCEFEIIGMRQGEKLHETLVSEGDKNVKFFSDCGQNLIPEIPYRSDTNKWLMSQSELRSIVGIV